ncbi:MAG: DMT family transporter [Hyphomicrobiaceae bacterium]|nr:DMT family transporter [Hyphomicrobiaceae bacterium]
MSPRAETSELSGGAPGGVYVRRDRPGLAILMMLAAMLAFAAMDGISKVLAQQLSIPQILWVRYILFTLLVALLLRRKGLATAMKSGQPWLQTARALLIVVENGVFVLAFVYLPLADVHAIAAASPLIVVALSVPMLGETVGPRRWLAVVVGFAGVLIIVRPGFQLISWPMLIALFAAFLWGLYQVLVRMCAATDSGETTWVWSAVVGLAATTLVGPFVWTWPDATGWALLVAIAILGSLAHLALIKALEYWEAGALQPYSYTLLLWAAVIGYLGFGDIPDRWTFLGAALIIASGLYAWHRERVVRRGGR